MRYSNLASIALIASFFLVNGYTVFAQEQRKPEPLPSVKSFTPDDIDKLIQKLSDFLFSIQLPDGNWPPAQPHGSFPEGWPTAPTAMSIYALIESGIPAKDKRIVKALDWLVKNQDSDPATYSVGLRCNAWLAANKQTNKQYQKNLEKDVDLLVLEGIHAGGGYSYICYDKDRERLKTLKGDPATGGGDNSNSQYLLLGAWAGVRSGIEIPKEFWEMCQKFWIFRQGQDGGWCYHKGEPSYGSMSTAGLASLFVCIDATMGDKFIKCNVTTEFAPVKRALDWFDANFEKTLVEPWESHDRYYFPYYMYGVERVGLASGYKYFGKYDWFKEGCKRFLAFKDPDATINGWGIANIGYELVFLSRGRKPVLFNRLEYEGDWNNRPRAMANFCRWAEIAYEHEVNWQIVTLKSDVGEWHDAPVLAITGSKAPKFSDADLDKLRAYVNQGGTLLSISECSGGGAFGMGMKNVYKKLFPKYELAIAGRDHPIYSSHYKMPGAPAFFVLSNGIRPLAIHTDADLPLSWQTYAVATAKANFEAGANSLSYVTEKELYGRGSYIWPDEPQSTSTTIKVARIRYAGNYDPEPLAFERLARLIGQSQKIKLDYTSALSAAAQSTTEPAATAGPVTGIYTKQLTPDIKLAFMTGTGAFKLADDEKAALKKWVDAGGILLIDAAGGNKAFGDSAKDLAGELWGADNLLPLPLSSPIYQMKDMNIEKVKYRKTTKVRTGGVSEPRLLGILAGDKPKVIISAEDLTAGLVGYSSWGLDGYMPQSALDIVRNIVLYAAAGKPSDAQPAKPATAPAAEKK